MVRIDDASSAIQILVIPLYPKNNGKCLLVDVSIYLRSAGVKVREAYAMGCSVPSSIRCASTAPSPTGEVHMSRSTLCVHHSGPVILETLGVFWLR